MKHSGQFKTTIVDNDPEARSVLQVLLAQLSSFSVVGEFAEGDGALARLPSLRPDIVFTDMVRPGLTGFEFTRRCKRLLPQTAVIFVSGLRDLGAVRAAELVGAASFIATPVSTAKLGLALAAVLAGQFYFSDEAVARLHFNPFLDFSVALPMFLTLHAYEMWEPRKAEPSFWPQMASDAGYRPQPLARIYGRCLRRTEADWRRLFGRSLREWLDAVQIARIKQEIANGTKLRTIGELVNLKSLRQLRGKFASHTGQSLKEFRRSPLCSTKP